MLSILKPTDTSFNVITRIETITPQRAKAWLDRLTECPQANRERLAKPVERRHVGRFVHLLKTGQFGLTHQGFLVGANDLLLDGRHRAMAILESEISALVQVTYDPSKQMAGEVIADTNNMSRSYAYITGLPESLAHAVRFLLTFNSRGTALPVVEDVAYLGGIFAEEHTKLIGAGLARGKKMASSAPVVSAFLLRLRENRADYVETGLLLNQFRALLLHDPKELDPLVYSFYRQMAEKRFINEERAIRLWRALDRDRVDVTRLLIKELSLTRALMSEELKKYAPGLINVSSRLLKQKEYH